MPERITPNENDTTDELFQKAQEENEGNSYNYSWLGKLTGEDAVAANRQELLNSYYQNAYNSVEAQKNRDWEEYMSNSANQRAAKDLEALGFSPMALLGGASSASTPSGYAARSSGKAGSHQSDSANVMGTLLKVVTSLVVGSAAAMKASAGALSGNTAATVAKSAAEGAAKGAKDNVTWSQLLAELDKIPKHA